MITNVGAVHIECTGIFSDRNACEDSNDEGQLQDRGGGRSGHPPVMLHPGVIDEGLRKDKPPAPRERKLPGLLRRAEGATSREKGESCSRYSKAVCIVLELVRAMLGDL